MCTSVDSNTRFLGVDPNESTSQSYERHLDRFSRFCRAHGRDQRSITQTTLRPHLCTECMRCGLIMNVYEHTPCSLSFQRYLSSTALILCLCCSHSRLDSSSGGRSPSSAHTNRHQSIIQRRFTTCNDSYAGLKADRWQS